MSSREAARPSLSSTARADDSLARTGRASLVDLLALVAILALAVQGPAFVFDDVMYFNYVNNVAHPAPIYFYNGYVSPILQIPTYLMRGLPFVVQGLLYRAMTALVIILLYRELKALFAIACNETEAGVLAVAIIFLSRFADAFFVTLLTDIIWSALFVSFVYVLRKRASRTRYSALGVGGIVLSCASNPVGLVLAPALLADAAFSRPRNANRALNGLMGIAILAWWIFLYFASPQPPAGWGTVDPLAISSAFVFWFHHEPKRQIVIIIASALALLAALVMAVFVTARTWRTPILLVSYLGAASYLFYLISPRFATNLAAGAAFLPHYSILLVLCAATAFVLAVNGRQAETRPVLNGAFFGFCLALAVVAIYPSVSGPLRSASEKYAFLVAAADFHATCQPGDILVFEEDHWSPVISCRPREFPAGFTPLADYKLWKNAPAAAIEPHDRPQIYSGTPVL